MTSLSSVGPAAHLRAAILVCLIAAATACGTDGLDQSTAPQSVIKAPSAGPAFSNGSAKQGIPFGFFRLDYSLLGADWTSHVRTADPNSIKRDLDLARSRGARVFLQLAGSDGNFRSATGSFSLAKFKERLDRFKNLDLHSYIEDGTLAGHMMIDEADDPTNWDGKRIPFELLEEAAKYSKSLWPRLPTLIRSVPTWLKGASFRWVYLDGGWAQYSARKGDVNQYRNAQIQAAKDAGLTVVWGLNVLNGGNGTSGRRGTLEGKYSMNAAELLQYGNSFLGASKGCGFLMWMYSSEYLKNEEVKGAVQALSDKAKTQPAQSCGRSTEGGEVEDGDTGDNGGTAENVPPTASFTASCTDLTCEISDASSDSDGSLTARSWDFGDGSAAGATPPHTFGAAGAYTVKLTVTDNGGVTGSTTRQVNVTAPPPPNVAPTAAFTAKCSGLSCSFTDKSLDSDGSVGSRSWSFGGGAAASGIGSYTYAADGTYTVTLTITDDDGATDTASQEVRVSAPVKASPPPPTNIGPRAYFGSKCSRTSCSFTDRSKDQDGTIVAWRWTFADGTSSTLRNPSRTYKQVGTYKVRLTVTDNRRATSTMMHVVNVKR